MSFTIDQFKHQKISGLEKVSYGLSNFGGNLVYATISSFATLYYTDNVKIAAATVGTMMLVARIFDALSDVAMGGLIDKTHRKQGQAKPWYIWSMIPLVLSLILIFALPSSWGDTAKVIYMYVTYIWSAVFLLYSQFIGCCLYAILNDRRTERKNGTKCSLSDFRIHLHYIG